jgi:hypothetical protein
LQVQLESVKSGDRRHETYGLEQMRSVPRLLVDDGGVWGMTDAGERLGDVHHRDHPRSKLRGTENAISIGLTSHYAAMRDRFGPRVTDGAAGENILIETGEPVSAEDVAKGLVIEGPAGPVQLEQVVIATPCAPFTRWCLGMTADAPPDRTVTEALRFLNGGMRGFYCAYRGRPTEIALGNRVFRPM